MQPAVNVDAVGFVSAPWTRTWSSADTLLYAVAVGAEQLDLTTENSIGVAQRAVPSYASLIGSISDDVRRAVGPAWDPIRLVYGGVRVEWHRELPASGAAELRSTVVSVVDKGSGALVETETTADGLFTVRRRVFLRGVGGFGGRSSSASSLHDEKRATEVTVAAVVARYRLPENAALVYRLTGDRHPLHSDPAFARRAGFDRPILHGLCTYGVTAMLLLRHVLGGDPGRMRSLDARFRTPVWPGDELELWCWELSPGRLGFRVDRVGAPRPAIDDGLLEYASDDPERARFGA